MLLLKNNITSIAGLALLLMGCVEEINNDLFTGQPRIVINGIITDDEGPYFVRITKSNNTLTDFNSNQVNGSTTLTRKDGRLIHEPILNAMVTLSDNEGRIDTLQLSMIESFGSEVPTWGGYGFYETTTDMIGKPGNQYTITVSHEGQTYTAVSTMPTSPPEIDEVGFVKKTLTSGQPEPYSIPTVSFDEPQDEENFYRFAYWGFSIGNYDPANYNLHTLLFDDVIITSDEFLTPRVEDLSFDAALVEGQGFAPAFGDSTIVYMYGLQEETFDYYDDLQHQLRSDGGAYSPAPASPRSNFSNGALGLWQAASISKKTVLSPGI